MDEDTIKPTTRTETQSSPETGTAGDEYWSKSGGHQAQEKVTHPNEEIEVENAFNRKEPRP